MKTRVGPKCVRPGGVGAEGRGAVGERQAGGGSHVCGKPCKQRFKMIKCFRSRSCVGKSGSSSSKSSSVLSCRSLSAFRACFSRFSGEQDSSARCKVSFSKNPHRRPHTKRYRFG
ncbi:hypothetical protein KR018_006461 [Drosophila ironensis]|nr:hypothetical protein KR018_006461 [Drosophila ironensis]